MAALAFSPATAKDAAVARFRPSPALDRLPFSVLANSNDGIAARFNREKAWAVRTGMAKGIHGSHGRPMRDSATHDSHLPAASRWCVGPRLVKTPLAGTGQGVRSLQKCCVSDEPTWSQKTPSALPGGVKS